MLSEQEREARNECDRFMCRGEILEVGNYGEGKVFGYFNYTDAPRIDTDTFVEPIMINLETLSQCTGVKDANGVMIFENDICIDNDGYRYRIEWHDGSFYFETNHTFIKVADRYYKMEIVGDKFSNPELLEAK